MRARPFPSTADSKRAGSAWRALVCGCTSLQTDSRPVSPRGVFVPDSAKYTQPLLPRFAARAEALQQMQEIAARLDSLLEEMKVIQHQASGVHAKGSGRGFRLEKVQNPRGKLRT